MAKQKINVTDPKYHTGSNMVYHASSPLGYGAVFREGTYYRTMTHTYRQGSGMFDSHHTLAWAKRMVRKGLGGSW